MWSAINGFLDSVDDFVWGVPLMVLIMAGGLFLTIRLGLLQVKRLPLALKWMVKNEEDGEGEVTSFAALCTALSATIGTGNIVGVATAISAGGPGALFWMIVAAFLGMATKYSEGLLAVKFRTVDADGHSLGGPFYYIEKGMGKKWTWLAKMFAVFGILAGLLGIGTITQINGITSAISNFFDSDTTKLIHIAGIGDYSLTIIISSFLLATCVALVLIGGIKRISKVAELIVPFMAILYVIVALVLIFSNITAVPHAIKVIVTEAFSLKSAGGAILGIAMMEAMKRGVARGIFSNEAGLGSAPIAAAAAQTKEPVRQGLITMTGTFIDTIVICTMTGLSIVLTGAYQVDGLKGVEITSYAFNHGLFFLPQAVSSFILMICLVFFAFTTILGWDYYSERCLEYLAGKKKNVILTYRWLYIIAVFIGPYMTVAAVWTIADIFNGLMALPNMIALFALSGVIVAETKAFFNAGKHKLK